MNVLFLSRLQFALTVSFHYFYPPLNIGLSILMVAMEALYLKTKSPIYLQMTKFWARLFGLTFAIGVATGIVMEFEFGTNWATYSRYVGDVFGSALAAEGVFAFFLESGFLGILLFGWNKVKPATHFFATVMVALGAHFSAVWIVVANSWQQTPAGFHIVGEGLRARAEITNFWAMVFNPSSVDRLIHVYMSAWATGAFFVMSVSAYYLLKRRHMEFAHRSLTIGVVAALLASWGQLATGHHSAQGVARNQPAKLAAFEGHFEALAPADLHLFGWVDEKNETVKGSVAIPGGLSWLVAGRSEVALKGLDAFPKEDWPPVNASFLMFHGMVFVGLIMVALSTVASIMFIRHRLFETRWMLGLIVPAVLLPQIANQLGWYAAEVGRQPWIVQGLLRTSDALSKTVRANQVLSSIILFSALYALLFALFIFLLDRKIKEGPAETPEPHKLGGPPPVAGLLGPRAEA